MHINLSQAFNLRHADKCQKMLNVAMYAAVG